MPLTDLSLCRLIAYTTVMSSTTGSFVTAASSHSDASILSESVLPTREDRLSALSQLSFADSISLAGSEADSFASDDSLDPSSPFSRHTLLVEVTRADVAGLGDPEAFREMMEAELWRLSGIEVWEWPTLLPERYVGSYVEMTVGLPTPGEKLFEERARSQNEQQDRISDEEEVDQNPSQSSEESTDDTAGGAETNGTAEKRSVTFTFELKGLSLLYGFLLGGFLARWA